MYYWGMVQDMFVGGVRDLVSLISNLWNWTVRGSVKNYKRACKIKGSSARSKWKKREMNNGSVTLHNARFNCIKMIFFISFFLSSIFSSSCCINFKQVDHRAIASFLSFTFIRFSFSVSYSPYLTLCFSLFHWIFHSLNFSFNFFSSYLVLIFFLSLPSRMQSKFKNKKNFVGE